MHMDFSTAPSRNNEIVPKPHMCRFPVYANMCANHASLHLGIEHCVKTSRLLPGCLLAEESAEIKDTE